LPAPATPPAATPVPGTGTAVSPDLGAVISAIGAMPFVPPAPEAPATGKRSPKTVPSKAVPSRVDGETMALDPAAQQRPTPTLPFVGSDVGPGYVPKMDANRYVRLCNHLVIRPKARPDIFRQFEIPTEATLLAVYEHWRHPARRAEVEKAMAALGRLLWGWAFGEPWG
jgi:hypothetical protein